MVGRGVHPFRARAGARGDQPNPQRHSVRVASHAVLARRAAAGRHSLDRFSDLHHGKRRDRLAGAGRPADRAHPQGDRARLPVPDPDAPRDRQRHGGRRSDRGDLLPPVRVRHRLRTHHRLRAGGVRHQRPALQLQPGDVRPPDALPVDADRRPGGARELERTVADPDRGRRGALGGVEARTIRTRRSWTRAAASATTATIHTTATTPTTRSGSPYRTSRTAASIPRR